MSSFIDKLNLRPQERRLIVGILVVIFVVLNILLVWPRFGDWKKVRREMAEAHKKLALYNKTIAQAGGPNGFEAKLKKLEGEGQNIVANEQEIQLYNSVRNAAQESKVMVNSYSQVTRSPSTKTNEFFEEQSITVSVNTGEPELVDFLLKMGSGASMIRVRDLDLKPADQNRYRLQGKITLSANYQKKPATGSSAPGATKPAAPTRPAVPSGNKP